jgi:hypothetical protein
MFVQEAKIQLLEKTARYERIINDLIDVYGFINMQCAFMMEHR